MNIYDKKTYQPLPRYTRLPEQTYRPSTAGSAPPHWLILD